MLAALDFSHISHALEAFHAAFRAIFHAVSIMGVWPGTAD
jgi:hypothetical protein